MTAGLTTPPAISAARRRWWLAAGWTTVAGLALVASYRGGIAVDLMFAIMQVVALLGGTDVLGFAPDWAGMAYRAAAVALAVAGAVATVRYQRRTRGACVRCGRGRPLPRLLLAAAVPAAYASAVPAVGYAALKLNWGFGGAVGLTDPDLFAGVQPWSPGMGDTAVLAVLGAGLTFALAYGWPRVPRWLLLTPAVVGIGLLLPVGLIGSGQAVALAAAGKATAEQLGGLAPWLVFGIYPTFLLWGMLLTLVTVSYHLRTRRPCRRCGQA